MNTDSDSKFFFFLWAQCKCTIWELHALFLSCLQHYQACILPSVNWVVQQCKWCFNNNKQAQLTTPLMFNCSYCLQIMWLHTNHSKRVSFLTLSHEYKGIFTDQDTHALNHRSSALTFHLAVVHPQTGPWSDSSHPASDLTFLCMRSVQWKCAASPPHRFLSLHR